MRGLWITAAAVSVVGHLALAWSIAGHKAPPARRWVDLELATPPPRPAPTPTTPPPAPEAAQKAPKPPPPARKLVARAARPAAAPAPAPAAPTPKVGIDERRTTPGGGMALTTGTTLDGVIGTGKAERPAPPAPRPAPPAAPRAGAGTGGRKLVPLFAVTRLPKARHAIEPRVPDAFRGAAREALVVVEVELDPRGRVVQARVLRGAGFGLDEAALDAARRTDFEPALVGSAPVAVRYQIPFRFRVRG